MASSIIVLVDTNTIQLVDTNTIDLTDGEVLVGYFRILETGGTANMSTYVGQRKRVTIALAVDDVATDGTVSGRLLAPDGTETALSITDDAGTGNYHSDFTVDQEGRWWVRIVSTGSVVAAAETYIDVTPSPFIEPN